MNKKRKMIPLLLAMAICAGASAQAEAPTSQFGYTGWPYRQPTACTTEPLCPTPAPTLDMTPVITQVPQTDPVPPTEKPVLTQVPPQAATPAPTQLPSATAVPTICPTASMIPTSTPEMQQTPRPTATATVIPTATPKPETTQKPVVTTPVPSPDDDYTTGTVGTQEEIAFLLLNQDRAANGLASLQLDPALCSIARLKSQDMKDNRYFSHTSPTYGSPSEMLRKLGYSFTAAGENIAHHATVEKSQAAFMSSDGHRRNILSSSWKKVGIGVVVDQHGFVYVTQLFVR